MQRIVGIGPTRVVLIAATATVLSASSALAQACIGYAQGRGGALSATVSFPEEATGYELNGMVASQEFGTFFEGGFGIVASDVEGVENTKVVHSTIAYEVEALTPTVSVCPAAGVTYSRVEGLNTLTVPFGVGVGATIPMGRGGSGLTPFAIPQFLYIRDSVDDIEDSVQSDVFVALHAGLTLNIKAFRVTGSVNKIFEEDLAEVFSVSVGAVWR